MSDARERDCRRPWPGLIEAYREHLPVTDATPVITLLEGGTPLLPRRPALGRARPRRLAEDRRREPDRFVQGPRA